MKIIEHRNTLSSKSKLSIILICLFSLVGCQERQVGSAKKSKAISPNEVDTKTTSKSKGGEFRASPISGSAFAITPKSGFKINLEYPWKMAALDGGVKVGEIKLDEEKATIAVELPADVASKKTAVKIKGSFSVCNEEKCLIYRDEELMLKQTP